MLSMRQVWGGRQITPRPVRAPQPYARFRYEAGMSQVLVFAGPCYPIRADLGTIGSSLRGFPRASATGRSRDRIGRDNRVYCAESEAWANIASPREWLGADRRRRAETPAPILTRTERTLDHGCRYDCPGAYASAPDASPAAAARPTRHPRRPALGGRCRRHLALRRGVALGQHPAGLRRRLAGLRRLVRRTGRRRPCPAPLGCCAATSPRSPRPVCGPRRSAAAPPASPTSTAWPGTSRRPTARR